MFVQGSMFKERGPSLPERSQWFSALRKSTGSNCSKVPIVPALSFILPRDAGRKEVGKTLNLEQTLRKEAHIGWIE
jgi:hypothetical protein